MARPGTPQISLSFPRDSDKKKIVEELAEKYAHMKMTPTTVARALFDQRLDLLKAGFTFDDPDTAALLALCISNTNPPSGGTLAQLRKYALAHGAEPGSEDLWLKQNDVATAMLRIGLSLAHAGLSLDDKDGLEALLNVAHNPHLLAAVRILTQMPKERLLQTIDSMESAAAAG